MRIAIPVSNGLMDPHFGHCRQFAFIDVQQGNTTLINSELVDAPPHQPGLLPGWLADQGVNTVLAGGLGGRAMTLLAECGIEVVVGVPVLAPDTLARLYMAGEIGAGANACDH